jgi:RNA polymerase sigma factor (TIGR02999 family)
VHEAYLRLSGDQQFENRGHFFAAAAIAMRRILVENARKKQREKHGGGRIRIALESVQPEAPAPREDLIALDAALTRLAAVDPQAVRLVELRHFAGFTSEEAALVLGVSPRTADRVWAYARAWLFREISESDHLP